MNKTFNRYFGALLFGALLVVSTTSTNLTAFQGDPFGSTAQDPFGSSAPDPLEKRTTETWQQFMVRMNQAGIVSAAQLQQWQSGKSITVATSVPVTRTRTETRTRTVMVAETNEEGVPQVTPQTQNYTVSVPYTENVFQNVTVPAPGSLAGNAKFDKFVKTVPPVSKARSDKDFQKSTVKASTENWEGYLQRLQALKIVNASQISQWKKGQPLKIEKNVSFTRYRYENRTRSIPVTRMVTQTTDDGQTLQVPVTEQVQQSYTVQVPYMEMKQVAISIPAKGAAAANATNSGVTIPGARPKTRNSFASARSKKKSRGNKKPSGRLITLMKIRPKQSDAQFERKYDLHELEIKDFEKDGSRIQEVSNGSRTLRQFADTDGDNKLDTWIFFKDGRESYREQDLDGDGKVDQYQFHEGGKVRNGIDEDQDGKIDIWDDE